MHARSMTPRELGVAQSRASTCMSFRHRAAEMYRANSWSLFCNVRHDTLSVGNAESPGYCEQSKQIGNPCQPWANPEISGKS